MAMGLDMYLNARKFVGWHKDDDIQRAIKEALGISQAVKYVEVEAIYWRKENHIHRWFVEHVQGGEDDCSKYEVTRKNLIDLQTACRDALDHRDNADQVLPTQSGFFFGRTDYDDDYFASLESTISQIDTCLNLSEDWYFTYQSSW
jgi:hypothetical protein